MNAEGTSRRLGGKTRIALALAVSLALIASIGTVLYVLSGTIVVDGFLPSVVLGPVNRTETNDSVPVAMIAPSFSLSSFTARLEADGVNRATLEPLADGASDWIFSFHDWNADRELSAGDWFGVDFVPPGDYKLIVAYRGTEVASTAWTS